METALLKAFDNLADEIVRTKSSELLRMREAAICIASLSNTPDSLQGLMNDVPKGSDYWTLAFDDVCVAAAREIKLLAELEWLKGEFQIAESLVAEMAIRSTAVISKLEQQVHDLESISLVEELDRLGLASLVLEDGRTLRQALPGYI